MQLVVLNPANRNVVDNLLPPPHSTPAMKLHSTLIRAKQAVTSAIATLERNPQTKLHLQQLKTADRELTACLEEVPLDGPGPDEPGPRGAEGVPNEPLTVPQGVQAAGEGGDSPPAAETHSEGIPVETRPDTPEDAAASSEDAAADKELAKELAEADKEQSRKLDAAEKQQSKPAAPKTFTEKVTDLVTKKKAPAEKAAPAKKAAKKK